MRRKNPTMKLSAFFGKFKSLSLWGNLAGMLLVLVLLVLGMRYGLALYTHHGEAIPVPNVKHKSFADAERILDDLGLVIHVSDTGYVKTLPPGCILEQSLAPGLKVKSGRIVYVTVNASHTPTITLPDIIDNSSLREAMAKLSAMGFKLAQPQFVPGERDWVYGILVNGKHVVAGDKISIEDSLTIQVGNGLRDAADSVDYVAPVYYRDYVDDTSSGEDFGETVDIEEPTSEPAPQEPAPQEPAPEVKPE